MDIRKAITLIENASVDSWDLESFMEGNCGYFALALSEATDWEIVMEMNGRDGNHVWCVNDQGRAVDIRGVHKTAYAAFPGCPSPKRRDVIECSASQLHSMCYSEAILERAREIVRLCPQRFGINS